jgi:Na+-transporting methylmalonyl-CoA/oxaloacetate decarboxylase gamma subunit
MELVKISFDLSVISGFGITVAIVGYLTVFFALVILYYVYRLIPRLIHLQIRKKLVRQGKEKEALSGLDIVGEENAAISMALYLYFNEHDEESHKLTIKNIQRSYTPWNSKIYSLKDYYKMK